MEDIKKDTQAPEKDVADRESERTERSPKTNVKLPDEKSIGSTEHSP